MHRLPMFVNGMLSGDDSSDFDDIRVKHERLDNHEDSDTDGSEYGLVRIKNRHNKRRPQPESEEEQAAAVTSQPAQLKRKRPSWEPWTSKENFILLICYAETHNVNDRRTSKDYDKIHARYLELVDAANAFSNAVGSIL